MLYNKFRCIIFSTDPVTLPVFIEFSNKTDNQLRASPCKPRPNLLNRGRRILLNLIYIVKGSVL